MLAVLLSLGIGGPAAAGGHGPHATPPALDGSWLVSVIYHYEGTTGGDSGKLQYTQQFHKDGRAVIYLVQNQDVDPYNESRTACVGDWKHRDGRTFDVTLYCLWQESWTDAPSVPDRIRMKVKLDHGGMTWTATPFYYEFFDGTSYVGTGSPNSWGEMSGIRLDIVPIK